MENVKDVFRKLELSLNQTLTYLKDLSIENFDENFNLALQNMKEVKTLRTSVDSNTLPGDLNFEKKKINFLAKQIEEEYDNIIRNYKNDISEVSSEIKKLGNKRKLVSYSGGIK